MPNDDGEEKKGDPVDYWKDYVANLKEGDGGGEDDSSDHGQDDSSDHGQYDDGENYSDSSDSEGDDDGESKVASFLTSSHNLIHNALKVVILFCVIICGVILYHDYTSIHSGPSVFCRTGHPGPPFEIPALLALTDGQPSRAITSGQSSSPQMVECLPCPPHATCQDHDRYPTCDRPKYVLDASGRACIRNAGLQRSADKLLKQALSVAQAQKGGARCGLLDSQLQKPLQPRVSEATMRSKLSEAFVPKDFSFEDVYLEMKQWIKNGNLGLRWDKGAYESDRVSLSLQCRLQEVFAKHMDLIIRLFLGSLVFGYVYRSVKGYFREKKAVRYLKKKVLNNLKRRSESMVVSPEISISDLEKNFKKKGKRNQAVWNKVIKAVKSTRHIQIDRRGEKEYIWADLELLE
jgi:hypothetical protein